MRDNQEKCPASRTPIKRDNRIPLRAWLLQATCPSCGKSLIGCWYLSPEGRHIISTHLRTVTAPKGN